MASQFPLFLSLSLFLSSSSMASHLSLQLTKPCHLSKSLGSKSKRWTKADATNLSKLNETQLGKSLFSKNSISLGSLLSCNPSTHHVSLRASSSVASSEQIDRENGADMAKIDNKKIEFNRVSCLVWVLHESARSFSLAVESLELAGSRAELAMAWNGKDVHKWHKHIAHQVAVYALLKTAVEVEILLSHDRHNNPSTVKKILTPKINLVAEYIECQLNVKHSELVQWFRVVELPRVAGFFIPLLKKWSLEYAGSGVAGIVIAVSCCAAVEKLGSGKISAPLFTFSCEDELVELLDLSHGLVEMDKLHQLATEAGFEVNFLSHFGAKVFPFDTIEELEFWIGLAQKKLSAEFCEEIGVGGIQSSDEKIQADNLATLGLFAYLGRKTRLFLSRMGIKDLDEPVKDFLSYLECGSLFIYPELACISEYQCFMEIVSDEIGWLEFYPSRSLFNQERKRSKQHAIQAEKDITLSTVFTVCYDVFSGFAHFSRSTQQPLDAELLAFLLQSQSLLTICLDDHLAVYDSRSRELLKIAETGAFDHELSTGPKGTDKLFVALEAQQKPKDLILKGCLEAKFEQSTKLRKEQASSSAATESNPLHDSLLKKYSLKLVSTSSDVCMGTQLLFVDIMDALEVVSKKLRGQNVSKRERKKLMRTLSDIATLIPVTILMLLPVSAIGHAVMLGAIKKYTPFLIPSPYSSERLDVVKQLKRTKKLDVQPWSNLEDPSSRINIENPSSRVP